MNYDRKLAISFLIAIFVICSILYVAVAPNLILYPLLIMPLLFYLLLMLPEYRRIISPSKFFLVDRKMRAPEFRKTYIATNVGLASSLMWSASLGYWFGISAMLWGPLTWALGILLYYLLFPKIIPHLKKDHTLHEFLANKFSTPSGKNVALRVLTSIVTSIIFWALLSVEIYMATIILGPIMGKAPALTIAIIVACVAFVYSYVAGYAGVVKTDKYQVLLIEAAAITMFVATLILFLKSPSKPAITTALKSIFAMDWLTVLAIFFVSVPYQICTMDMWQRTFAMSSGYEEDAAFCKDIRKHLLLSIVQYTLLFWVFISIGISVRAFQGEIEHPNLLLNSFMNLVEGIGPVGYIFSGIMLLGIISSIVSTVDSLLNSFTQTFMYDVYSTLINRQLYRRFADFSEHENQRFVALSRFFLPFFGISGTILVFFVFGIFNFLMNIYALVVVLFPAILYAILSKPSERLSYWGPFLSIASGFVVVAAMSITGTFVVKNEVVALYAPVAGLAVSLLALLAGCKLEKTLKGAK